MEGGDGKEETTGGKEKGAALEVVAVFFTAESF